MITVERIEIIRTAPQGTRLVVVRVLTSEPGLYGLGCATCTLRDGTVEKAIEELEPLALGWDVHRIEDFYQAATTNAYWRNGPIINNAISGIDMALWDIKAKIAGLPLYQLFGGKTREAVTIYGHAGGDTAEEVAEDILRWAATGVRHIRCGFGAARPLTDRFPGPPNRPPGEYYDALDSARDVVDLLFKVREIVGPEIELMHDLHERFHPAEAIRLAKELDPVRLFFLEDPLPPEQLDWFDRLREQSSTPIAMGELFVHPAEWIPLIKNRLIDFIRCHISTIGGITPARKLAMFSDVHGVRTAWHGPLDVSPVGHAANMHLDIASPNFGIQEYGRFADSTLEVFPGMPELRGGYAYLNDKPGLGVEIDDKAAAKYPPESSTRRWGVARRIDGSVMYP